MEPFLVSVAVVALNEVGGTTQCLAALMAARWNRPVSLLAGIFLATLLNHGVASTLGWTLARVMEPSALAGPIGVAFIAMAVWTLIPQNAPAGETPTVGRFGLFGATLLTFAIAEIGDRSQFAALALTARYHDLATVVAGTTLGMLLADVPAVLFGQRVVNSVARGVLNAFAALLFAGMGVLTLTHSGRWVANLGHHSDQGRSIAQPLRSDTHLAQAWWTRPRLSPSWRPQLRSPR